MIDCNCMTIRWVQKDKPSVLNSDEPQHAKYRLVKSWLVPVHASIRCPNWALDPPTSLSMAQRQIEPSNLGVCLGPDIKAQRACWVVHIFSRCLRGLLQSHSVAAF